MFITIEGPDGSGKTTQVGRLAEYLEKKGITYLCTREPGGTVIGDKIRKVLLDPENSRMCPKTEVLLYAAARAQLVAEVVRPALENGQVVVSDRYLDSSFAYQAFGLGESPDFVRRVNEEATGDLYPNLTLVLDIEPEEGMKRLKRRKGLQTENSRDRIELKDLEFHQKVREGYLFLASIQKNRIKVIDAHQEEEAVNREIIKAVQNLLYQKGYKI